MSTIAETKYVVDAPEGYKKLGARMKVEGAFVAERSPDHRRFARGTNHRLQFKAEPDNEYDKNAIRVFGAVNEGRRKVTRLDLGYVPADVAKVIADRELCPERLVGLVTSCRWVRYDDFDDDDDGGVDRHFVDFNIFWPTDGSASTHVARAEREVEEARAAEARQAAIEDAARRRAAREERVRAIAAKWHGLRGGDKLAIAVGGVAVIAIVAGTAWAIAAVG
jgi:hypothetical protein